jgi:hypothetical protein
VWSFVVPIIYILVYLIKKNLATLRALGLKEKM